MGLSRRVLCISLPYVLSLVSLICMIFVAISCTQAQLESHFISYAESVLESVLSRRSVLDNIASTVSSTVSSAEDATSSVATAAENVASSAADTASNAVTEVTTTVNKTLTNAVDAELAKLESNLPDFYLVGLWSYCNGTYSGNASTVHNCTTPSLSFRFDFAEVLGLQGSGLNSLFPAALQNAVKYYNRFIQWTISAFLVALIATSLVVLTGLTAGISRWASLLTSFFAVVAMFASFGATLTGCLIYATLVAFLKLESATVGITASMGWLRMVSVAIVATVCAAGAGVGWLFTVCCVSGRRTKRSVEISQPIITITGAENEDKVYNVASMDRAMLPDPLLPEKRRSAVEPPVSAYLQTHHGNLEKAD
ncbi:hypothetical protein CBS63078_11043 [Aspergillus niger]|nr:hypothetical protein CBS63078_11043 [Aspergillus niger]